MSMMQINGYQKYEESMANKKDEAEYSVILDITTPDTSYFGLLDLD